MSNPYDNNPGSMPTDRASLDADLVPAPGRASAIRLALYAGLFLFPVAPALLLTAAFATSDGGFADGFFALAMSVLAAAVALIGLLILLAASFLLLIYRGQDLDEAEVFGSPAPAAVRRNASGVEARSLDLRFFWGVAFLYLLLFCLAQLARPFIDLEPAMEWGLIELVGGIVNVVALLLFFYFWTAGFVRLNRAGLRIHHRFFLWPSLAVFCFFLPVILN